MQLFSRSNVPVHFPTPTSWQRVIFSELEGVLTNDARPFPCLFGVAGFKSDQLRFSFLDEINAKALAGLLDNFLPNAKGYGQNTSLVVFERPSTTTLSIKEYEQRFWNLLRSTSELDSFIWPSHIPKELDHPSWEFCYRGEPIFVVCNTPAHVLRQSRRASTFMLTFQPRWVFENILGTEKAAKQAFFAVSNRLEPYDFIEKCPALGRYGDPHVREWKQYFLPDENSDVNIPFTSIK